MADHYDVAILGSGSGAFAAAIKAAELGAKVLLAEKEDSMVGGTCLNVGCVPTKNLLYISQLYWEANHHPFRGLFIQNSSLNFSELIKQKHELIQELRQRKYLSILESNPNIQLQMGDTSFLDRKTIQVGMKMVTSDKFIIATGARAGIPPIPGLNTVSYLTNREILALNELPASLLIIGGGVIAVEFAQMFARFGSQVTILEAAPRILTTEEPEISERLTQYLEEEGIRIHVNVQIQRVSENDHLKVVEAQVEGKVQRFQAQELLIATGRRPNTETLGLEKVGVKVTKHGAVEVDETLQTAAPIIWAIGDVIGKIQLVPMAAHEGAIAADNAMTGKRRTVDYSVVPYAIFTSPQIGSVGLKETQAKEKGLKVKTNLIEMKVIPKAAAIRNTKGFIKVIADTETGRLLGMHILSELAADIIHEAAVAIRNQMTLDDIIETIHVYPTMAEGIKIAAQSFEKDVSKLSCCAE